MSKLWLQSHSPSFFLTFSLLLFPSLLLPFPTSVVIKKNDKRGVIGPGGGTVLRGRDVKPVCRRLLKRAAVQRTKFSPKLILSSVLHTLLTIRMVWYGRAKPAVLRQGYCLSACPSCSDSDTSFVPSIIRRSPREHLAPKTRTNWTCLLASTYPCSVCTRTFRHIVVGGREAAAARWVPRRSIVFCVHRVVDMRLLDIDCRSACSVLCRKLAHTHQTTILARWALFRGASSMITRSSHWDRLPAAYNFSRTGYGTSGAQMQDDA